MSLSRARPAVGRRARRALDRARNPEIISRHAIDRFVAEVHHDEPRSAILFGAGAKLIDAARAEIRALCAKARRIHRGKDSVIIDSPPWFIFYRDRTVITVMHKDSPRKW